MLLTFVHGVSLATLQALQDDLQLLWSFDMLLQPQEPPSYLLNSFTQAFLAIYESTIRRAWTDRWKPSVCLPLRPNSFLNTTDGGLR